MQLRRLALALGSLALVGSLAACDLPGGTPPQVSYDVAPNDTREEAPTVPTPVTIRGTVDEQDYSDWYQLTPPSQSTGLYITCTGDIEFYAVRQIMTTMAAPPPVDYCDGTPRFLIEVDPSDELFLLASYTGLGGTVQSYTLTAVYGPVPTTSTTDY